MIRQFILGEIQENGYLVVKGHDCYMIDPGAESYKILDELHHDALHLMVILLTHGHFDHIGAIDDLVKEYHCPVYASHNAILMTQDPYKNLTARTQSMTVHSPMTELGDSLTILGEDIQVISTPGHTDGDVCFYVPEEEALFTGDTLFKGAIGRTDFPTGSLEHMILSLEKLKNLDVHAYVFPGHGPSSTLDEEKKSNEYLNIDFNKLML